MFWDKFYKQELLSPLNELGHLHLQQAAVEELQRKLLHDEQIIIVPVRDDASRAHWFSQLYIVRSRAQCCSYEPFSVLFSSSSSSLSSSSSSLSLYS